MATLYKCSSKLKPHVFTKTLNMNSQELDNLICQILRYVSMCLVGGAMFSLPLNLLIHECSYNQYLSINT